MSLVCDTVWRLWSNVECAFLFLQCVVTINNFV